MPTTRQRHAITETDAIAQALEAAADAWPGERPATLLVKLIELGHQALADRDAEVKRARRAAIERAGGIFDSGVYGPGYLDELRGEWVRS